jgi:putative ABC transport system permease protein
MKTLSPPRPPRLGYALLSFLLKRGEHWGLIGDFDEIYAERAAEKGRAAARVWYWGQIARFAPAYIINSLLWSKDMFKNHLIVAWRNIKKSKAYSALNILGLAIGMAVFILIMLYVRYELSYDRYHANARDIYRIIQRQPGNFINGSDIFAGTPPPLAPALIRDFPEILSAARITSSPDVLLSVGEKNFVEKKLHWADPQTFDIFSFPFIRGDGAKALKDPSSILLSERASRRLFGNADPVGRTIVYHAPDKNYDFTVAGVFRDIPSNSHFSMDIVAPFDTNAKFFQSKEYLTSWGYNGHQTYIQLRNGTDARALENKLPAFLDKNAGNQAVMPGQGEKKSFFLQGLTRIHLFSSEIWPGSESSRGDVRLLFLFSSIAVLVLMIACVNYMNLETARSLKRIKEIGLRKVVGAGKGQIVRQFLGDSLILTFIALSLAVGIVLVILPGFRSFIEREIIFNPLRDTMLAPALVLLAAFVGLISGSYPAFFVSAGKPVFALKSAESLKSKRPWLRNALIVFQFAASITLIICTIGVRGQLQYIRNKDMGFQRDQILVLRRTRAMRNNIEAFKTELKRNPAILNVSVSSYLPNLIGDVMFIPPPASPDSAKITIKYLRADCDFVSLFGLHVVRGRNFSREFPADASESILINESAQKALGLTDPIGFEVSGHKIIGVVKDFHMQSLHFPIEPVFISTDVRYAVRVSMKIRGDQIPETLAFIRNTWKRFEPNYPFEYSFFDEIFDQAYRTEQRLGTIFSAFAGLAVLIACLGLIGLASFTAEQKTKEIGIRKVLGASSSGVIVLLSREFMKWVVLANVIAWPIGYFAMKSWLRSFAYKTSLTVPMFLGAGLAAFLIAAAVISFQTYKAASANPADSIRYE